MRQRAVHASRSRCSRAEAIIGSVAAIAAFVFLEKVLPGGKLLSWCTGALLAAWGVWVVSRAV